MIFLSSFHFLIETSKKERERREREEDRMGFSCTALILIFKLVLKGTYNFFPPIASGRVISLLGYLLNRFADSIAKFRVVNFSTIFRKNIKQCD